MEMALSESLGMPVHLRGVFSIRLVPSVGVSGTDLWVGETDAAGPFVQSNFFQVEIALLPLFDKKLHILALSASQGLMDPQRFQAQKASRDEAGAARVELPRIERLVLEDFSVDLPGHRLLVQSFELSEFDAGKESSLSLEFSLQSGRSEPISFAAQTSLLISPADALVVLDIETLEIETALQSFEAITGTFSWMAAQQLLEGHLDWQRADAGVVSLTAAMDTDSIAGTAALDLLPHGKVGKASAQVAFKQSHQGIEFPSIRLSYENQQAEGSGCLVTGESVALNLSLVSDYVNLDLLEALISPAGEGGDPAIPFALNLNFSVREIHAAGTVAHHSEIQTGKPPDCSIPLD